MCLTASRDVTTGQLAGRPSSFLPDPASRPSQQQPDAAPGCLARLHAAPPATLPPPTCHARRQGKPNVTTEDSRTASRVRSAPCTGSRKQSGRKRGGFARWAMMIGFRRLFAPIEWNWPGSPAYNFFLPNEKWRKSSRKPLQKGGLFL